MRTIGKTVDRILLDLVAWRLGQCEEPHDVADQFGDGLVSALQAEFERRGRCVDEDELRRHRERHKKFE
jgi:hypothetical protein